MAPKKRKTTTTKVKKKKWFPIYAPKSFNEVLLGESYVNESAELEGKYITSNLSTITRSMRKQSVNIQFKVTSVADGKGQAQVIGYSLINAAVKRLVRRGRNKIVDSFLAKSKDKHVLRVKPVIITRNRGTKSVQSALRLEARRLIREIAFTKTTDEFFPEVSNGKLQKQIKEACSKIFPLRSIDIKYAKILENTDVVVTDKDVVSEKVNIRVKDKGVAHAIEEVREEEAHPETSESFGEDADDLAEEDVEEIVESEEEKDVSESIEKIDKADSEAKVVTQEIPSLDGEEDENSEEFQEEAEEEVEEATTESAGVESEETSEKTSEEEANKKKED